MREAELLADIQHAINQAQLTELDEVEDTSVSVAAERLAQRQKPN